MLPKVEPVKEPRGQRPAYLVRMKTALVVDESCSTTEERRKHTYKEESKGGIERVPLRVHEKSTLLFQPPIPSGENIPNGILGSHFLSAT